MAHYRVAGSVPPKRHTQHRTPDGGLYFEELMGEEGFSSDSSLLYHRQHPLGDRRRARVGAARPVARPPTTRSRRGTSRHTTCSTAGSNGVGRRDRPPTAARQRRRAALLRGRRHANPAYRNAIGDECLYVESGTADVETVFGDAARSGQGDYVLIPRATTHRGVPTGGAPAAGLRHRGQHAHRAAEALPVPLRPAARARPVLRARPARPGRAAGRRGQRRRRPRQAPRAGPGRDLGTVHVYPQHPFDVVGWDGCLYPYAFNISDFEPITGRVHQPPPAHQVFEGHNFVICNFVPRKVDYHPLADPGAVLPLERRLRRGHVLLRRRLRGPQGFRHRPGLDLLHPGGHAHGPQPGAYERSIGAEFFDELAVMVDTFRPLDLGEAARRDRRRRYAWSWSGGRRPGRSQRRRMHVGRFALRRALRRRRALPARQTLPLDAGGVAHTAHRRGRGYADAVGPFVVAAHRTCAELAGGCGPAERCRSASSSTVEPGAARGRAARSSTPMRALTVWRRRGRRCRPTCRRRPRSPALRPRWPAARHRRLRRGAPRTERRLSWSRRSADTATGQVAHRRRARGPLPGRGGAGRCRRRPRRAPGCRSRPPPACTTRSATPTRGPASSTTASSTPRRRRRGRSTGADAADVEAACWPSGTAARGRRPRPRPGRGGAPRCASASAPSAPAASPSRSTTWPPSACSTATPRTRTWRPPVTDRDRARRLALRPATTCPTASTRPAARRRASASRSATTCSTWPSLLGDDTSSPQPTLNAFMAQGRAPLGRRARAASPRLLTGDRARRGGCTRSQDVTLHLPFEVADYVDFYASEHHASNLGRLFRPDSPTADAELEAPADRLPRPRRHRSSSPAPTSSGPCGQRKGPDDPAPVFGPSVRLDIEAELGFVVGTGTRLGDTVALERRRASTSSAWCCSTTGRRATSRRGSTSRSAPTSASRSPRRSRRGSSRCWRCEAARVATPRPRSPQPLPYLALRASRGASTSTSRCDWNGDVVSRPPYAADVLVAGPDARPPDRQRRPDCAPVTCSPPARSPAPRRTSAAPSSSSPGAAPSR